MSKDRFTEDVVEQAALAWFESIGYDLAHGPDIAPGGGNQLRTSYSDTILEDRLRSALAELNPNVPENILDEVYQKASTSTTPDLLEDNRIFHAMLTNGVDVEYRKSDGSIAGDKVWLIDFDNLSKNNFLVVSQFTVVENQKIRRPDIVVFVNGMPLAIVELKNAVNEKTTIFHAHNQLQTYKAEIPSLFRTNALLIISDGIEARIGSLTASNDRFMPWRTIDGVHIVPKESVELETLLRGAFEKNVFLELIHDFVVFEDDGAKIEKKIAAYHQYYAVSKAVKCTVSASSEEGDKRIGVVWHTQGSGKSLSIVFFAGKIIQQRSMRNPTIVVVTDRNDLDDQLFSTFCKCENLLHQTPVQATSRKHLVELLSVATGSIVFTTIQKFSPDRAQSYPLLSDRRNIVVIADEAHRSQYDFIDGFARHIRDGLPNASFIGFTGTPIELSDRDTYAIFGEEIHTYSIRQAVEDGATVQIYYESRLSKIELDKHARHRLEDDFQEVTEGEETERKEMLKSKWARLEALVGTEKRVNLIAHDLVDHFERRLEAIDGKAMAVCMSRRICVDLYNAIIRLRPSWHDSDDGIGVVKVIMTGSASDPETFQPHIRNKTGRDLISRRARDTSDSLKLIIVRDMWLTGFDVPSMHTMYIDKPMQGHGLMQAIARVNRVFKDKPGGLVVDYLGIADRLKEALVHYSKRDRSETSIFQGKVIATMLAKFDLCKSLFHDFDYSPAISKKPEDRLRIIPVAMEYVLSNKNGRERFMQASLDLSKAFALCAATDEAREIREEVGFFQNIRSAFIKSTTGGGIDLEELNTSLQQLVSNAVVSTEMIDIFAAAGLKNPEISILSDEFLAEVKELEQKNLALEMLKKLLEQEIHKRSRKNAVLARNFMKMLESTIQKYHGRLIGTSQVIDELVRIAKEMREEARRGKKLGLSDDESAFYYALTESKSTKDVLGNDLLRKISREITESIRKSTSIDWTIRESMKAKVRVTVKRILRKYGYPPDLQEKATQTVLEQATLLSAE